MGDPVKKWILRALWALPVLLTAGLSYSDYTATQGSGTTVFAFVCSVSKVCPASVLINSSNTEIATASNPVRTDPTGTTAQPVTNAGTFAAQLTGATNNINNIAGTVSLPTGASTAAKQPALGTAGASSTDVLTVQGIASMTALLTNPGTAANWGIGSSTQNSATVANGQLALAQFNTTPTTITTGNMSPLQMDNAGNLLVNIKAGAGSGGTAIADNAVFTTGTTSETPIGCYAGTPAATANHSTIVACTTAGSVHTTVDNTNANGSATSANSSPVVIASDQTAADACMYRNKTNLPISQNGTASVQLIALSGSTVIYVCSLALIAAGATTVALTTGTGTACATGNAAVIGTTTANIANSMSLAANGGLTLGNGVGTIAKGVSGGELCMVLGTSVFVSGNLTYVQI